MSIMFEKKTHLHAQRERETHTHTHTHMHTHTHTHTHIHILVWQQSLIYATFEDPKQSLFLII